ncbi:hypothetical protein COP2_035448 [Malus domestica]
MTRSRRRQYHNITLAVYVTELSDAVFIRCFVNHAVIDDTSFWNFSNTFAELCRASSSSSAYSSCWGCWPV